MVNFSEKLKSPHEEGIGVLVMREIIN